MSFDSRNVGIYSQLLHHRSLIQRSFQLKDISEVRSQAQKTIEYLKQSPFMTLTDVAKEINALESRLSASESTSLRLVLNGISEFILSLPVPIDRAKLLRNRRSRLAQHSVFSSYLSIDFTFSSNQSGEILEIKKEIDTWIYQLEDLIESSSFFGIRLKNKPEKIVSYIVNGLAQLEQNRASLDSITVRSILKIFVKMVQRSNSEIRPLLQLAQAHLYALNPASAVQHWLNLTGFPWFGSILPKGHSLEGAMILLRWLSQRESESETEKNITASRFQREQELLFPEVTLAGKTDLRAWWRSMLQERYPNQLAHNLKLLTAGEEVEDWIASLEKCTQIRVEINNFLGSPHLGTRTLAASILVIIEKLETRRLERGL